MSTSADIVSWVCFVVGIAILIAGVWFGYTQQPTATPANVTAKLDAAKAKVAALQKTAVDSANKPPDADAAVTAASQGDEVQGVLGDISGIVGSLPENLRFAGLLVLVGTVLMSVATVQFGGHSLF